MSACMDTHASMGMEKNTKDVVHKGTGSSTSIF